MPNRCAIFWAGSSWSICELATDRELELGPFSNMHDAWLAAHEAGLRVDDVWTTRRTAKPRPRPDLPTMGPA